MPQIVFLLASDAGSPSDLQIIAMNIIDLAVTTSAESSDTGIACSGNAVHFGRRQLASSTTTQYSIRHNWLLNIKFPLSLPDKP